MTPPSLAAALPIFERLVGKDNVREVSLQTTADDYAVFAQQAPSLYFWIGVTPPDRDPTKVAFNHSPQFYLDEAGMITGVPRPASRPHNRIPVQVARCRSGFSPTH
jgi:amidohydrolase